MSRGSGVLIWHVDEGVMARAADPSAVNNQAYWQAIALEEADGYRDIGHPVFERQRQIEGSPDDPFFAGGQTLFGPATRPDSRSNREWETGIEIEVLSTPRRYHAGGHTLWAHPAGLAAGSAG